MQDGGRTKVGRALAVGEVEKCDCNCRGADMDDGEGYCGTCQWGARTGWEPLGQGQHLLKPTICNLRQGASTSSRGLGVVCAGVRWRLAGAQAQAQTKAGGMQVKARQTLLGAIHRR